MKTETRIRAGGLLAAFVALVPGARQSALAEPTVSAITLVDGRVYQSAKLELSAVHLMTAYGQLTIPTNDLIRITFAADPGVDTAATIYFVAVGRIQEESFSGHTPGAVFTFHRDQLASIDFGLPPTLAASLPEAPLRILWLRDEGSWVYESIYRVGALGYSELAQIAENLGAGNTEVTETTKLTPELLADYHAIVFLNRDSGVPLTTDEKLALRGFLGAGKGVLVIGQQDWNRPLSEAAQFANSVALPYGIELTTMIPNTNSPPDSSWLIPHPVTRGLSSAPGWGSLLRVTPPAQLLALTTTNSGVLAVSTFGTGRMVVVSDDSNLWDNSLDSTWPWSDQRNRLAVNILKWLLLQPPRLQALYPTDEEGYCLLLWGVATQNIRLQRSADLENWADWTQVTATGTWQDVHDSATLPGEQGYYRAILDP